MNDEFLDKLEELLSKKKVEPYKKKFSDKWFEAYKSELEQAKEIFIYLHFLEIFLRNKINDEFSIEFGNWLFDQNRGLSNINGSELSFALETFDPTINSASDFANLTKSSTNTGSNPLLLDNPENRTLKLNFKEQEKIDKAIVELTQTKKEINSDNIVSSLSFGFWTNLFHKSYNYPVWDRSKMMERVFPFLKPHQRNLKQIQKEMEAIRKLRNRVFHFENLQSWNFAEIKKLVDKFIYGVGGFDMIGIMQTNHKF